MSPGEGEHEPAGGPLQPSPAKADQPKAKVPDRELIERFIENQAKEIAVRNSEVELEKHRVDAGLNYSHEALAAQERDREAERQCARRGQRDKLIAGLILVVIVCAFASVALYLNKEAVVVEFGKDAVLLLGGGAGGYGLGRRNNKQDRASTQQAEDSDP